MQNVMVTACMYAGDLRTLCYPWQKEPRKVVSLVFFAEVCLLFFLRVKFLIISTANNY